MNDKDADCILATNWPLPLASGGWAQLGTHQHPPWVLGTLENIPQVVLGLQSCLKRKKGDVEKSQIQIASHNWLCYALARCLVNHKVLCAESPKNTTCIVKSLQFRTQMQADRKCMRLHSLRFMPLGTKVRVGSRFSKDVSQSVGFARSDTSVVARARAIYRSLQIRKRGEKWGKQSPFLTVVPPSS